MKVYRYLTEAELNNIKNNDIQNIGHAYPLAVKVNTFIYQKDKKYLHFYKNKYDMKHIRNIYENRDEKFYFCEFNIPKLVLYFAAGKGYYKAQGFDINFEQIKEYAIMVDNFKPKWLKKYTPDNYLKNEDVPKDDFKQMFRKNKNNNPTM